MFRAKNMMGYLKIVFTLGNDDDTVSYCCFLCLQISETETQLQLATDIMEE